MAKYYHMPQQPPNRRPDQNQAGIEKTRTMSLLIIKSIVGLIFIVAGLKSFSSSFVYFVVYLIIGVALIAWGLTPYLEEQRNRKAEETEKILSAKVPGFEEEDEAEKLAKKYTDR